MQASIASATPSHAGPGVKAVGPMGPDGLSRLALLGRAVAVALDRQGRGRSGQRAPGVVHPGDSRVDILALPQDGICG